MTHGQPTADTIRATATALGKARLLDDKIGRADEARILAWAEQVQPYRLTADDLLHAVGAFYIDNPTGRTMQIGDLVHHARQIRRERTEQEPDAQREARQAELDARFADQAAEIAASKGQGRPKRGPNPLTVRCPWCRAAPLTPCTTPGWSSQRPENGYHPARFDALAAQRGEDHHGDHA